MALVLKNGKIITPIRVMNRGSLVIQGGEIVAIGESVEVPSEAQVIDVGGRYIAPGFIDIHLHGGGGADVMDGTVEALETIARTHAKTGTTALLPTTLTAPIDDIRAALEKITYAKENPVHGAKILGAHVEGPYFAFEQRGAQNPEFLKKPEKKVYRSILDQYDCVLRFSAAPELEGALELGRELSSRGILASIAHSDATYQQVLAAVEAGYSHATHMFSGMSGLRRVDAYRVSGVIESTLLLDELTTELIADGHHLPPSLMKLVMRAKGLDQVAVVTDAMAAAGLGAGEYSLGGLDVIVEDQIPEAFEVPGQTGNYVAKLLDRSAFAGSVATMDQLVRNMVNLVGLSIQDAVKTATVNPAKILGIDDERGTLAPGMKGDVVVFDEDIEVQMTVVEGQIVYAKAQ